MVITESLKNRAEELSPWRYDHVHGDFVIKGDPVSAPIHGAFGRGAEIMRHTLKALGKHHDLSTWRAIDLGCLEGHYAELLCEAGFAEVVCVDLSVEQVERARFLLHEIMEFKNVRVLQGSIEDKVFLKSLGRFNLILFHGLLYHLQDPVGVFDTLRSISAGEHYLLLSTQFKFTFAEVIAPSPLANIKIRSIKPSQDGMVRYEGTGSTYLPHAVRLNPWALHRLLQQHGYGGMISYDTPLGCTYGLQLNLILSPAEKVQLVDTLNTGHDVFGLQFNYWNGNSLDSMDFRKNWRARLARFVIRIAYSVAERLGQSANRLIKRQEIACRSVEIEKDSR
jgi:SAM-dependent methyltransferase